MNILAIANNYPTKTSSSAGIFCAEVCQSIARMGHRVRVLVHGESRRLQVTVQEGVEVVEYPYAFFWKPALYRHTEIMASLKRSPLAWLDLLCSLGSAVYYLQQFSDDCDLVHAFWYLPAGAVAAAAKLKTQKPLVVTALGGEFHLPAPWLFKSVLRFVASQSNAQTAFSRYLASRAPLYGVDPHPIEIVPNSIQMENFPFQQRPAADKVRILLVNRLIATKRVQDALEAIAGLPPAMAKQIEVWIAGDGPERAKLETLTRQKNLDAFVRFLGNQPRTEIPKLLQSCDIFVNPTVEEGMATVNLEAMATGLCVIATWGYSNDEVIEHEKTGFLYPPRDTDALRRLLARAITNEGERRALGKAASETVRRTYDSNIVAQRYLAIYKKILTGTNGQ